MFGKKKPEQPAVDPVSVVQNQRAALKQHVDSLIAKQEAERHEVNEQRLRAVALKAASQRSMSPAATLDCAEKYLAWLKGGSVVN